MAKGHRLALQQVLYEIFMDPLSEDDAEENYSDSTEYLPELDEEAPKEVTDARNEPVRSASNQSFCLHRTGRAVLCGGCGHYSRQFCSSSMSLFKDYK